MTLQALLPTAAAATSVTLEARDDGDGAFFFARGDATNPTIEVASGDTLVVTLVNAGTTGHNWQVGPADAPLAAVPFPLAPNATGNATLALPEGPARLRYYCLAHEAFGMRGDVVVAEAGIPSAGPAAVLAVLAGLALAFRSMRRRQA